MPSRYGRADLALNRLTISSWSCSTVRPEAWRSPVGKNAILPSGRTDSTVSRSGWLSTDIFTTSSGPRWKEVASGVKLSLDGVGANSAVATDKCAL